MDLEINLNWVTEQQVQSCIVNEQMARVYRYTDVVSCVSYVCVCNCYYTSQFLKSYSGYKDLIAQCDGYNKKLKKYQYTELDGKYVKGYATDQKENRCFQFFLQSENRQLKRHKKYLHLYSFAAEFLN